jgi:hypothetical protein
MGEPGKGCRKHTASVFKVGLTLSESCIPNAFAHRIFRWRGGGRCGGIETSLGAACANDVYEPTPNVFGASVEWPYHVAFLSSEATTVRVF